MILEEATYEAYEYYASTLSRGSHKPILTACEFCGEFRVTSKNKYYTFCRSCSMILGEKQKGEKNPNFGKTYTEEHKANIGAKMKGIIHTEETKVLMSTVKKGENNPNWKNGISFEPYCIKFNDEYKEYIRNLFGNECFLCGKSQINNGKRLSVHHSDYNKDCGCDDTKCLCVPLCMSCHVKTNYDRDFWECLIIEMLKPFVAWA